TVAGILENEAKAGTPREVQRPHYSPRTLGRGHRHREAPQSALPRGATGRSLIRDGPKNRAGNTSERCARLLRLELGGYTYNRRIQNSRCTPKRSENYEVRPDHGLFPSTTTGPKTPGCLRGGYGTFGPRNRSL